MQPTPHFDIPLNLPHAATVAERIESLVERYVDESFDRATLLRQLGVIRALLSACRFEGENPPDREAERLRQEAARLGRTLVPMLIAVEFRNDRIGQCVRNYFECLALGEEGARLGLEAGENPGSVQRPA